MSAPARRDPLLRITRLMLWIAMAFTVLGGVALMAGIPAIWIFGDHIFAEILKRGVEIDRQGTLSAISGLMLGGFIAFWLASLFLHRLIAVIDTVERGSPFIPQNAARLRAMAWIALAIQGVALLVAPLTIWLHRAIPHADAQIGLSFNGVLMALLLFILARVFDHGSRLEEDVEGTV